MAYQSLKLGAITVSTVGLHDVYTCPALTRTAVLDVAIFVNTAAVTGPQVLITPSGGGPPYGVLLSPAGSQPAGTLAHYIGRAMMAAGDKIQAGATAFGAGGVFYVWASGQEYS